MEKSVAFQLFLQSMRGQSVRLVQTGTFTFQVELAPDPDLKPHICPILSDAFYERAARNGKTLMGMEPKWNNTGNVGWFTFPETP